MTRFALILATGTWLLVPLPFRAQEDGPKDGDAPSGIGVAPMPSSTDCATIDGPFRFCGSMPSFEMIPAADDSGLSAFYMTPEGIQAIAIIEDVGLNHGLTLADLRQSALEIVAEAAGVSIREITLVERSTVMVRGQVQPNFVYSTNIDGTVYTYSNTMIILPDTVAQFITVDTGTSNYTPRHRDVHNRFLSGLQIEF